MLNKKRLLTPGPTPLPEEVRLALAKDMIHHRKGQFQLIMLAVQDLAGNLFGTSQPVLPLACSGTGAMTAAVYSLFSPGDEVLVIEGGKFGERWAEIAKSRELTVRVLSVPWGEAATPAQVADELAKHKNIKGILTQLCETSAGVLQPVKEFGEIKGDALLVVDGISAVGISPCPMDEWRVDCLLTGSQKGLMLPPGLALLALSPAAWKICEKTRPGCYYFDLPREKKALEKGQTAFTTPVNLIYGLLASLRMMKDLTQVYTKQWALTSLVRAGATAMGLELLAERDFSWGVTAIKIPEGIDSGAALKIMEQKYGVYMAGGQDRLKGKIVRLGHMGWVDWGDCLIGLCALAQALLEVGGFVAAPDYFIAATRAYNVALRAGYPR